MTAAWAAPACMARLHSVAVDLACAIPGIMAAACHRQPARPLTTILIAPR